MIISAASGIILALIFDYATKKFKKGLIIITANIILECVFIGVIIFLLVQVPKEENLSEKQYFRICNYVCASISCYLYIQQCINNLLHNNNYFYSTMLKTLAYSIPQLIYIRFQPQNGEIIITQKAHKVVLLLVLEIVKIVVKHSKWLLETKGEYNEQISALKEISSILIFLIHNILLCITKQIIYDLEQKQRKPIIITCFVLCIVFIFAESFFVYKYQKKNIMKQIYIVVEIENYLSLALMLPMVVSKNEVVIAITYIVNSISIISTLFLFTTLVSNTKYQLLNGCLLELSVNIGYDCSTLIFNYTQDKVTTLIIALLSVSLLIFDILRDEDKSIKRPNYNSLLQTSSAKNVYYRIMGLSQAKIQ